MQTTVELEGGPLRRAVLALGADMKNAVAVGMGNRMVLSPPLGCLDDLEALERFEQEAEALPKSLNCTPGVIAVDLHPDMRSSRFGRQLADRRGLPVVEVQHHHAHAAACLAENGLREGLALVMDGTGWGGDGTIWGAELLEVRADGTFKRLSSFAPVPLPGGDAAVRQPVRQVIGRWVQAGIPLTDERLLALGVSRNEAEVWARQCQQKLNAPLTHAAGRLFDSFSAVLGIAPREISYEGQPAIMLEKVARRTHPQPLQGGEQEGFHLIDPLPGGVGVGLDEESINSAPFLPFETVEKNGLLLIDWAPAFRRLEEVVLTPETIHAWAMALHVAVARAAEIMIDFGLSKTTPRQVGLSGGVFLNRILIDRLSQRLAAKGIVPLLHRQTPPGDGCIALGQVVVAGQL